MDGRPPLLGRKVSSVPLGLLLLVANCIVDSESARILQ